MRTAQPSVQDCLRVNFEWIPLVPRQRHSHLAIQAALR
jgi:hypothetical protein